MHGARAGRDAVEAVAIGKSVVNDGRAKPVAQVLQIPLERGRGHLEFAAQSDKTDAAA